MQSYSIVAGETILGIFQSNSNLTAPRQLTTCYATSVIPALEFRELL